MERRFCACRNARDIVEKLNKALVGMTQEKATSEKMAALGFDAFGSTPDELGVFVATELVKWSKLVKNANIQPE